MKKSILKRNASRSNFGHGTSSSNTEIWSEAIKKYLMSKKKLHVLSYQDLSRKLALYEIKQTPKNLSAKFNQGTLSAALMISSLLAMGEKTINLNELNSILQEIKSEKETGKKSW